MKLLTDRTVPASLTPTLQRKGHDVLSADDPRCQAMDEAALWQLAQQEARTVVTSDDSLWQQHSHEGHHGIVIIPARYFVEPAELMRLINQMLREDDDMKLQILQGISSGLIPTGPRTDAPGISVDKEEHGNLYSPHRRGFR